MALKPVALVFVLAAALQARAQVAYTPLHFPLVPAADATAVPPLPFRFVGRLVQNGRPEVLLMRGRVLHSIAEGDEIDGEYRVERVTGASIHFTYLPGQVRQNLDLTAASR